MLYEALDQVWTELIAPGAPFEVVEAAVGNQRLRVFRHAPPDVRALWLSTTAFAERDYLIYGEARLTYGQAHAQVAAAANWLADQGVRPGDRVAIAMRNYPEWMLIYWACVSTGLAVVGMNAWWTAEEAAYVLRDSAPKVVFCDAERLERIVEAGAGGARLVAVRAEAKHGATSWAEVIATPGDLPTAEIDPDADACIFYTSGTTGAPKGAQLTHRGCVANLMNISFFGQAQAMALARSQGIELDPAVAPPPIALLTTPLFHVTANNCGAYAVTAAGGAIVLMYRWDAGEAVRIIERERVTTLSGVPVMSRELLAHPDFARCDTSSLLNLGGGGAPLQPDLVARIDAEVATARPQTGYGMTETCGIITSVSGDFFVGKPESVGRAVPTLEARVVDDDGATLATGVVGELWVKGSPVIKGYLNRPDATAEAITEGWLHTGDLARIDEDGFIYIVDRKKDMVLRGGENVYCAEVEACVHRHPAVAECCVFGVMDARLGEEVAAALVLHPGALLGAEDLRAHCALHISRHKIPRYVWFMTGSIPRNANGKFLKRQLRDTLKIDAAA